jgi:hypothetical protein
VSKEEVEINKIQSKARAVDMNYVIDRNENFNKFNRK